MRLRVIHEMVDNTITANEDEIVEWFNREKSNIREVEKNPYDPMILKVIFKKYNKVAWIDHIGKRQWETLRFIPDGVDVESGRFW